MKRSSLFIIFLLVYLGFSIDSSAQSFYENSEALGISSFSSGVYGSGVSTYDWNEDGYDDLVLLQKDSIPAFYLNNGNGFDRVYFNGVDIDKDVKTVCWVDINNDGYKDLSFNVYEGGPAVFLNLADTAFLDITEQSGILARDYHEGFGHSWADYNKDGYLDLFVCNYNTDGGIIVSNFLYRNNGDLTFTDVTSEAGILNDQSATFLAVWFDSNNDNRPDLFVMNDRSAFRNYMYTNRINNTFIEVGVQSNFDDFMDSMSGSVADYNNDGFFDIYVTNSALNGNKLFANSNGNAFAEVSAQQNLQLFQNCWGATWLDFDNDGWQDIFIATELSFINTAPGYHFLYKNYQQGFELEFNAGFGTTAGQTYISARGDFNNDGFPDLLTNSTLPLGTEIWMNDANSESNYLKVRLKGNLSNRDGIGSKIEVSTTNEKQYRYTLCGEDYLIQNSQWQMIGLGQADIVDSLSVLWPSGHRDVFYNIQANQNVVIEEGSSITNQIQLLSASTDFCIGDSVLLSGGNWESYLWSTGDTTQQIIAYHSDTIFLSVFDGQFYIQSDSVILNAFELPVQETLVQEPSCFENNDGSILIQLNPNSQNLFIEWESGESGFYLENLIAGHYSYSVEYESGCIYNDSILLIAPPALQVDSILIHLIDQESDCPITYTASAIIEGGTAPYSYLWSVINSFTNELVDEFEGDSLTCISPIQSYEIHLQVEDVNGCIDSMFVITETVTNFQNSLISEDNFQLNPNPVISVVAFPLVFSYTSHQLLDLQGRNLTSQAKYIGNNQIDLSSLTSGIYILIIEAEGRIYKRIVKKK